MPMAAADTVPVKLEVSVNPSIMSAPKTVEVKIKVTNVGDGDLPGNVTLTGPSGKVVTDFGDGGSVALKIGTSYSCTTSWAVTQAELDKGKISYTLKYPTFDEAGNPVTKSVTISPALKKSTPEPQITVKRTLSNTMAKKNDTVTITYEIENTGEVAVEALKITENKSIATKTQSIAKLEPNRPGVARFEVVMGEKDLTSEATITYKAEGAAKTYTHKVEAAKITFGAPSLAAKLEASAKQANIDETVKLKLTLSNTGNMDYQNIRVTDALLGELFTNQQVPAKSEIVLDKELTVREDGTYVFTVEATDASGNTMTITTGKVEVRAIDPSKVMQLQVSAASNREVIYEQPGVVKFTVNVTNSGEVDAKDVKVTCGDKLMYTFDEIKAGETKSFTRDVSATIAGKFQFVAATKDQLDNTVKFESNIIQITYTQPTPEPTQAPTLPAPVLTQLPMPTDAEVPASLGSLQGILKVLAIVLLVFLIIALGLLVMATIRRMADKKASDKAYDHLELAARRDYSKEAKTREKANDEPETPDEDAADEKIDLFSVDLSDEETEEQPPEEPEEALSAEPEEEAPKGEPNEPVSAMSHGRARRSKKTETAETTETDVQA